MIDYKICKSCGEELEISNFYKKIGNKDGYNNMCKKCCNKERKLYTYSKICTCCEKEYVTTDKKSKYCSKECSHLDRIKTITVKCSYCEKDINMKPSRKREHNFCNNVCKGKFASENIKGKNHHKYNCKKVACSICGKELIRHNCKVAENKKYYCSNKCKSIGNTAENSPNWNVNITNEQREDERKYAEYTKWRQRIFEKNSYTCQCCGDNKGGNLVAHHILNYSEYDKLKVDIENGITLCNMCHKSFHDTYGYKHNTDKQLKEFLNKHIHQAS